MTPEQFDAVIVGAGFGGIGAAIQLKRLGYDNFVILDREDDLGGTWHVNRYPGLAVDVPTTTYSYFFEPNPNWSRLFTPGPEIKQYADDVADKFDVRRHMRFNTVVEGARWDEEASVWRVTVADGETLSARYLITATGFLSQPKVPDIPGVADFAGKVIHTTAWDDSYPLEGRRVAVIGTGATAVQLIPQLAKKVADLTVYQRTPIWVVPKIDLRFGERAKRLFTRIPLTQRAIRWLTDSIYEVMINTAVIHHRQFHRLNVAAADLSKMHRFASIRDKELRRKLTPDYDFGCKRPTFSNGFYRAFTKPHVHLQTEGIVARRGRRHRQRRWHQDRHRHLDTGHRLRLVGGQLPRHRGHRARGAQPWKVVARHQVPGLPGCDDAVLPELLEPRQSVRVPWVELLQHHGVPDATHGPVVR